jgi:type II secretory pathway pseudopilin PulG
MIFSRNHRRRSAFTLVEMLVASALIIFMMYVIASAFESGLESFRKLKVQGDMQEKLRAAATAIRLDLTAPHFGDDSTLSDQRLNDQTWQPRSKGYFRISQPAPPAGQSSAGIQEGADPDNPLAKYYLLTPAAAQNLYLQFTVNLTNGHPVNRDARARADQYFMTGFTNPPGNNDFTINKYSAPDFNNAFLNPTNASVTTFSSYWAEVAYFVKPNGKTTDGAIPLYDLYRRQVLLVEPAPPNPYPPTYNASTGVTDVSWWQTSASAQQGLYNGSADVTEPVRRWGSVVPPSPSVAYGQVAAGTANSAVMPPLPTIFDEVQGNLSNPRAGGDLLITNVVNFEIKVLWEPVVAGAANSTRFNPAVTSNFTPPSATNNPDYPFDYLPVGINPGFAGATSRVFDTWSSNTDTVSGTTYNYGTPVAGPNVQQEYGAWNQGHFSSLTGAAAPRPTQYTIPLRVRVRALQIKLRIWDQKTSQTRQITIIQDM